MTQGLWAEAVHVKRSRTRGSQRWLPPAPACTWGQWGPRCQAPGSTWGVTVTTACSWAGVTSTWTTETWWALRWRSTAWNICRRSTRSRRTATWEATTPTPGWPTTRGVIGVSPWAADTWPCRTWSWPAVSMWGAWTSRATAEGAGQGVVTPIQVHSTTAPLSSSCRPQPRLNTGTHPCLLIITWCRTVRSGRCSTPGTATTWTWTASCRPTTTRRLYGIPTPTWTRNLPLTRTRPAPTTWKSSPSSSSSAASSWASPRPTWGWPSERSMAMSSRRPPSVASRRCSWVSRTCASSSPCCRSGWRRPTPRQARPPPSTRSPRKAANERSGRPSRWRWKERWSRTSSSAPNPQQRRSRSWPTSCSWRRRWCGCGSATAARRKSVWRHPTPWTETCWCPTARTATPRGRNPACTAVLRPWGWVAQGQGAGAATAGHRWGVGWGCPAPCLQLCQWPCPLTPWAATPSRPGLAPCTRTPSLNTLTHTRTRTPISTRLPHPTLTLTSTRRPMDSRTLQRTEKEKESARLKEIQPSPASRHEHIHYYHTSGRLYSFSLFLKHKERERWISGRKKKTKICFLDVFKSGNSRQV